MAHSGRFFEALLNSGKRRGTHAYELRNDKSRRPGACKRWPRVVVLSQTCAVVVVFEENVGSKQRFSCFWSLNTGKIRPLVQKIRVVGRVRQVVA